MRKINYNGTKQDIAAEQRQRLEALIACINDEALGANVRELTSLVSELSAALRKHTQTVRSLNKETQS